MRLRTGKTSGFVVVGKRSELYSVANIVGSRYMTADQCVRLPCNTASWRALKELTFSRVSISARKEMNRLAAEYSSSRRKIREATRKFKTGSEETIPVPLKLTPYEHQVRAFGYCHTTRDSALFGDTGTGKTLIAIAVAGARFLEGTVKRLLVVCPKGVLPVWPREFRKHADFNFEIGIKSFPVGDFLNVSVINFDSYWRMKKDILKWKPDMVIYDESHRLKSHKSNAGRFGFGLHAKVYYKMIMTGTPFAKCLSEVYAQYGAMNQDVFGKHYGQFRDEFLEMGGFMNKQVQSFKNMDVFNRKLHENSFRMIKSECVELPPVSYQNLYVTPDAKTRKVYKEMKEKLYLELDGEEISAPGEAVRNMKLRQILGGSVKSDNETIVNISKQKLTILGELLNERRKDKTLIFFSFKQEILMAQQLAKKMKMKFITLQGSTPDSERMTFEDRFQNDDSIELAFINIQCGAEGITLTAANMAVFYSPTYSYIWHFQARDRIHRIGQTRACTWVNILFTGTIDEDIAEVLESNGRLAESQLNQINYSLDNKTKEPPMAKVQTGYKASDVATELGIAPSILRGHLRALEIEKPENGWVWPKKTDKGLVAIVKQVKARIAELAKKAKEAPKTKADPTQPDPKKAPKETAKAKKARLAAEAEASDGESAPETAKQKKARLAAEKKAKKK